MIKLLLISRARARAVGLASSQNAPAKNLQIQANREQKELSSIEVEEWGEEGQPQTLFFSEVSARDMSKIQKKHADFINNPTMDAMVEMIILKCQTADGEKAFDIGDKPVLKRMGADKVTIMFTSLFSEQISENDEDEDPEEVAAKN